CERSGAVTLRGRSEPAEIVQVHLPRRSAEEIAARGGVSIRIPEQGGLPRNSDEPVRGILLLAVVAGAEPDAGVHLVESPPQPPPPKPVEITRAPTELAQPESGVRPKQKRRVLVPVAVVLIVLWIALLAYLRLTGRG